MWSLGQRASSAALVWDPSLLADLLHLHFVLYFLKWPVIVCLLTGWALTSIWSSSLKALWLSSMKFKHPRGENCHVYLSKYWEVKYLSSHMASAWLQKLWASLSITVSWLQLRQLLTFPSSSSQERLDQEALLNTVMVTLYAIIITNGENAHVPEAYWRALFKVTLRKLGFGFHFFS